MIKLLSILFFVSASAVQAQASTGCEDLSGIYHTSDYSMMIILKQTECSEVTFSKLHLTPTDGVAALSVRPTSMSHSAFYKADGTIRYKADTVTVALNGVKGGGEPTAESSKILGSSTSFSGEVHEGSAVAQAEINEKSIRIYVDNTVRYSFPKGSIYSGYNGNLRGYTNSTVIQKLSEGSIQLLEKFIFFDPTRANLEGNTEIVFQKAAGVPKGFKILDGWSEFELPGKK